MSGRRALGVSLIAALAALVIWQLQPHLGAQRTAPTEGGADLKALARQSLSKIDGDVALAGLHEPVEIVRDKWGVPHIYARNVDDLFFAQGYVVAQDRLWELYMWRMDHEGRLAEILGPSALEHDKAVRMAMFRGPWDDKEWTSYHPDGKRIFTAFANGLNAYITQNANDLPVEFKLTGLKPDLFKPETLLLRVPTLGDGGEITLARLVARVGVKEATRQRMPDPWSELVVPEGLDLSVIGQDVQDGMRGRGGRGMPKPQIVDPYAALFNKAEYVGDLVQELNPDPGSNNWVIAGKNTVTGKPLVANDPHREVGNPSLRYISHLVAPGWDVIGASEAPFVGVALGHNERVAWGLTIAGNDQSDVFVEETNPANPNEMKYKDAWEPFKIVRDEIKVKGTAPQTIEFKVGRHGPVLYEDAKNHRAYAVRSAFQEPGTASYIGGLSLDQAKDCKEFLELALHAWKAPTESLNCGDVDGNIALQSSAYTPNRRGWDGRLPVPGTGKFEWDGFRNELPRRLNPPAGYIATANNNINTTGYWPPVTFKTLSTVPFDRITRIEYVINEALFTKGRKFTIEDSEKLQHDAYMLQASYDQDLFKGWSGKTPDAERARSMIAAWNAVLDKDSAAAAIYETWRTTVDSKATDFGRPLDERRPLVEPGLVKALDKLKETQGPDMSAWRWGRMHTQQFDHPFVKAYNLPTIERSGGTGSPFAGGASYREIMDVADWDRSVVTNVPGESGQPESEFYGNLLPLWDRGEYFPMLYSRAKVDQSASHKITIRPASGAAR